MKLRIGLLMLALLGLSALSAMAAEKPQEWEVLNPMGVVKQATIKPAPRPTTLEGKTIVLRWNGKHNGDVVQNHLAELLAKKYPTAKIIKSYETGPDLNKISATAAESERITKYLLSLKPDIVIASQCD